MIIRTGKHATTTKEIVLHQNRYKITADVKNFEYRIGVPISFTLTLTYHDDTPVMITESNRDILIGQKYKDGSTLKYWRYQLNTAGSTEVKLIGETVGFDVMVRNDNFIWLHVVLLVFVIVAGKI